jgi:D-glycerate 3-kinase
MPRDLTPLARAKGPLTALLERLNLHDFNAAFLEPLCLPIAEDLAHIARAAGRCQVVGISGGQGTGKSTLASALQVLLQHGFGLRSLVISLDDYYLTKSERNELARRVHPLLATRGVPGTHDGARLQHDLTRLRAAQSGDPIELPRFSKALDDRASDTRRCEGPCEIVLLEGWCVGARAQSPEQLAAPLNRLEREEDPDASFRRYVNAQLAQPYAALWRELDAWVFLAAPDIGAVRAFRAEQERALGRTEEAGAPGFMNEEQLRRFVEHFERITTHMLCDAPSRADLVVYLGADRSVKRIEAARRTQP